MSDAQLVSRIDRLCRNGLEPRPTSLVPSLEPRAVVRAVLFDVYGTLLVSGCGDIGVSSPVPAEDAFAKALAAVGRGGNLRLAGREGASRLRLAIEASHANAKRRGVEYPEVEIRDVWREVLRSLEKDGHIDDASRIDVPSLSIEYECRVNPTFPMPGLLEAIAALRSRGCILGIVSNAQFYTPLLFSALLGRDLTSLGFESDLCEWSFRKGVAKPALELYRGPLARLSGERGIEPGETLFVGNDLLNDIWPASGLGCRTALFGGDERSLRLREGDERCADLRPDWTVTDLRQIPGCIR